MELNTKDVRYVYSACCTWHGPIQEVKDYGIPGCPHCGSPLFEYENEEEWNNSLDMFVTENPELIHYKKWMASLRVKPCRPLKDWNWREDYNEFVKSKGYETN